MRDFWFGAVVGLAAGTFLVGASLSLPIDRQILGAAWAGASLGYSLCQFYYQALIFYRVLNLSNAQK